MQQPWECCAGPRKGAVSQGSTAGCHSLMGREQSSGLEPARGFLPWPAPQQGALGRSSLVQATLEAVTALRWDTAALQRGMAGQSQTSPVPFALRFSSDA